MVRGMRSAHVKEGSAQHTRITPVLHPGYGCAMSKRTITVNDKMQRGYRDVCDAPVGRRVDPEFRSEEHTSELQSLAYLVCRLLLEKKKARERQASAHSNDATDHSTPTPNATRKRKMSLSSPTVAK